MTTLPTTLNVDTHGYPHDDALASIRDARPTMAEAALWLRETLPDLISEMGYGLVDREYYAQGPRSTYGITVYTGGWSGMEELMGAVMSNNALAYYWQSTHRGGRYVFEVPARVE